MKPATLIGKQLVQDIFKKQIILTTLGTQISEINHGSVTLKVPKTPLGLQHHGFFHGGLIATLADTAAGLSCFSLLKNPEHSCITIEFKINFLRPADGQWLSSVGKVIKQNKGQCVAIAEVFSDDKLCAYMLQTVKKLTETDSIKVK